MSTYIKAVGYKSLVRPILEYASPVWCLHTSKDIITAGINSATCCTLGVWQMLYLGCVAVGGILIPPTGLNLQIPVYMNSGSLQSILDDPTFLLV